MDKDSLSEQAPQKKCGGACCRNAEPPRGKLHCYDWLGDVPGGMAQSDLVEVQFKNTRKGFFRNSLGIDLAIGDMVAVEASPGHDIGQVTLTGRLVALQMKKAGVRPNTELKRVFRKAKPGDIDKYNEARARENDTMIRARKIAEDLHLNMKIGDVEFQGDGNKAIFYYIADERVDFRQLIKVLAETFKVRIEMKQIGARQEAGRIGGIGPCGRPLCCTTWMTSFVSVSTGAARYQDISLNPQKLAGQCAKLKCCLNFEVDSYVEASRKLPGKDVRLETADSTYYYFKADIFKGEITYSTDKHVPANLVTLSAQRALEVAAMNKRGEKPLTLKEEVAEDKPRSEYADILGQDSLTRFDKKKKKRRKDDGGNQRKDDGRREKRQREGAKDQSQAQSPSQGDGAARKSEPGAKPQGERQQNRRRDNRERNSERQERSDRPERVEGPENGSTERRERHNGRRPDRQKPKKGAPGAASNPASPKPQTTE